MPRVFDWSSLSKEALAPAFDVELDVRGYNCPIPLLRAKKALAAMARGQVLKVLTTDPGAEIDLKVFAEASGNSILKLEQTADVLTLLIEKKWL